MGNDYWLQDPRATLSERTLVFSWALRGNIRQSSVRLPNLLGNPLDTWGDWGPMHNIKLHPWQQILVVTRCDEGKVEQVSHLRPARLHVDSPMRVSERTLTPLVLKPEDGWRGFRYCIGLDESCRVATVVVEEMPSWVASVPELRLVTGNRLRSMQRSGLA